jgi:hypothetical protein
MKISQRYIFSAIVAILLAGTGGLFAQGHFAPGVPNIRDYVVPEPGFYGVLYNYWYDTDQLNDSDGNKISSITINPGPGEGITLDVNVDVNIYALAPTFIWVSDWKVAGARYAAYISPTFSNSSIRAALTTETGQGVNPERGQFAAGDLFVQPLWLGWSAKHLDVATGYGFYAPIGKYNVQTIQFPNFPTVGPLKVAAADNIGLGFWTHQLQGALALYPSENRAMAVTSSWTYEINGNQRDFDLTPGQYLTWNWGISQYLPLSKDQKLLMEVGPCGYSQWQVSDDTGSDVRDPGVHDRAHAAGVQTGLTYVPWNFAVNFRYQNEFSASSRFQGQSFGLNVALKF